MYYINMIKIIILMHDGILNVDYILKELIILSKGQ